MTFSNVLDPIYSVKNAAIFLAEQNIESFEYQIEELRRQIESERQDITARELEKASLGEASQAIESALLQARQAIATINSVLTPEDAIEATTFFTDEMTTVLKSKPNYQEVIALLEPSKEIVEETETEITAEDIPTVEVVEEIDIVEPQPESSDVEPITKEVATLPTIPAYLDPDSTEKIPHLFEVDLMKKEEIREHLAKFGIIKDFNPLYPKTIAHLKLALKSEIKTSKKR